MTYDPQLKILRPIVVFDSIDVMNLLPELPVQAPTDFGLHHWDVFQNHPRLIGAGVFEHTNPGVTIPR
ncbi:MAG TPA: hypothetical protein VNM92_00845 [Thermoanaerobaculia bacterium]|nr:hypothetical protein [Thermoanaerobaculia bacterium]